VETPVSAAGEVTVEINSPEEVENDSYFIVTVDIGNVLQLNAAQFDVVFDPGLLNLESISNGKMNDGTVLSVQSNEIGPGEYRIICSMGLGTVNGEGYIARLNFIAIKSGISEINLVGGILSGFSSEIPATWTGSSVLVVSTEPGMDESANESTSQSDGTTTGGVTYTGGGTSTTGTGTVIETGTEGGEPVTGTGTETGTNNGDPAAETSSIQSKFTPSSELEYGNSADTNFTQSSETATTGIESEESEESVSQENTSDNVIKWPVLWGIMGSTAVIIGLVVHAQLGKRYFL